MYRLTLTLTDCDGEVVIEYFVGSFNSILEGQGHVASVHVASATFSLSGAKADQRGLINK